MIEPTDPHRSISAQYRLLSISRSSCYHAPAPETEEALGMMRVTDAAFLYCLGTAAANVPASAT